MNLCASWCESSNSFYVVLRLMITCWFHLLSAERGANLRICKFPEHDFVPVGTLTLIQAATVCQGLRPYYCATRKKGLRPVAEIWSGLHTCTTVHVCLRVWVPSCTKWKYRLWKPSMKIYRVSKKNWVLPNWAFGDPAASWEKILMIFVEKSTNAHFGKTQFF